MACGNLKLWRIEMSVVIDSARWTGGFVKQLLDLEDDSMTFIDEKPVKCCLELTVVVI